MIQLRSLGRLFSGIKGVYNEINPATLTGAMDVIVVEDQNGFFNCGPFHVRFGKMGTINPEDKLVEIYVNGEQINFLHMRLGKAGNAYFVEDIDAPTIDSDSDSNFSGPVDSLSDNEGSLYRIHSAEDITENSTIAISSRRKRRKPRKESSMLANTSNLQINLSLPSGTLESESNSPSYISDNECERSRANILIDSLNTLHLNDSPEGNVSFTFDENPIDQNISTEPILALSPKPSAGVYLEDLVTSQIDENTKQTYIYVANSKDLRSTQYSSQELNIIDAGYRSDTEKNGQFSMFPNDLIHELKLSLCGGLSADSQINEHQFCTSLVTFEEFSRDPASVIANPNLVVLLNGKFYNWNTAAPILLSYTCFRTELPYNSILHLEETFMPKKRLRKKTWFSWGTSEPDTKPVDVDVCEKPDNVPISSTHDLTIPIVVQPEPNTISDAIDISQERPQRKISLTSDEIINLRLKPGANIAEFRVVTKFQGTCSCSAKIYLWRYDEQLIVSDVDGTITRSDLLGHFLPMLGHDWTHDGVAELYSKIADNGYKFVYLSARAIGQASVTRSYLEQVRQRGNFVLPDGPILLSPTSLIDALHREVIERKPELFKIKCLLELKDLFGTNASPFFAAFGNRTNDVLAYSKSGFELCRLFTVNPNGILRNETLLCQNNSYNELISLVDYLFPTLTSTVFTVCHYDETVDTASNTDSDDECSFPYKSNSQPIDMSVYSSFSFWRNLNEIIPTATKTS